MNAADIFRKFAQRDIIISLTQDGQDLSIAGASKLTDEERHYISCYKTELLWRLRHPAGDLHPRDYTAKVFVNDERIAVPLGQLADEGKEIMQRENMRSSNLFDPEFYAASVAISRYDQAHREWVEANEDAHMRQIRNEAQANVARLRNQSPKPTKAEGKMRGCFS